MKVNPGWLQQIESSKPVKGNVPAAVSTAILLRLISRNRRNMVGEFIQSVRRDTKKKRGRKKAKHTRGHTEGRETIEATLWPGRLVFVSRGRRSRSRLQRRDDEMKLCSIGDYIGERRHAEKSKEIAVGGELRRRRRAQKAGFLLLFFSLGPGRGRGKRKTGRG